MSTDGEQRRTLASVRSKLDMDRAKIENAASDLIQALNRVDQHIKRVAPARETMLQLTNAKLQCAILMQELCLAEVTLWNEL